MQHVPDHVVATAQAPPRLLQELRETLQRLRLGGPFYVLLWLLAGVAADLWLRAPVAFSLITFGFVALTVVRFRVHGLAEGTQEDDVRGRLDFIWLLLLVNAGLWGAASAWLLAIAPEESARSVAVVLRLVRAFHRHAEVGGLLVGERGQLHADLLQVQARHFLVQLLRQDVDLRLRSCPCWPTGRSAPGSGWRTSWTSRSSGGRWRSRGSPVGLRPAGRSRGRPGRCTCPPAA
jgi:hypothetical protein